MVVTRFSSSMSTIFRHTGDKDKFLGEGSDLHGAGLLVKGAMTPASPYIQLLHVNLHPYIQHTFLSAAWRYNHF